MNAVFPLSLARIRYMIEQSKMYYEQPDDSSFSVETTEAVFRLDFSDPSVCCFTGEWKSFVDTSSDYAKVVDFVMTTNATRMVPKAFTIPLGAGQWGVGADACIVASSGLNDRQLSRYLEGAYLCLASFFADLDLTMRPPRVELQVIK